MTDVTAAALKAAADRLGIACEVNPEYLARGSMGRATNAIVFEHTGDFAVCAFLAGQAADPESGRGLTILADLTETRMDRVADRVIVY